MSHFVEMENGTKCEILGIIGEGGQGIVYKVKYIPDGKTYALKVYKPGAVSRKFFKNLSNNIVKGSPNDSFIWPKMVTKPFGSKMNRVGYLMDLKGNNYSSMAKLIKGKVTPKSTMVQIKMLLELIRAFESLHAKGYSYQDLNDGGIVFDVDHGKVQIFDNDNVAPYGENLGIKGKFKYMAPEVAISMFMPDKYSDYFSLAVLIFMILLHGDPLEGIRKTKLVSLTLEEKEKIYGTEPVFIFHPDNQSNPPDPTVHKSVIDAWDRLPDFIQELFIKTFTKGVPGKNITREQIQRDRQLRATDTDWIKAMNKWMDSLVTCPHCGVGTYMYLDHEKHPISRHCTSCGNMLNKKLPTLTISKGNRVLHDIILESEKKLYDYQLLDANQFNKLAEVIPSKRIKDYYAIKNLCDESWSFYANTETRVCTKDTLIPCIDGIVINFGNQIEGEIHAFHKYKESEEIKK